MTLATILAQFLAQSLALPSLSPTTRASRSGPFAVRRFAMLGVFLAAILLAPGYARAQVKDIAPYDAIVIAEKAQARPSDSDKWYAFAELTKGQMVRVTGEGQAWVRIACPPGINAFVAADAGTSDAGSIRLTRDYKPKAPNLGGVASSWAAIGENVLPSGTRLKLVSTVNGADNSVAGYLVTPPDGARGYLEAKSIRRATPEEVEAARRARGETTPAPTPPTPAPTPAPKPETTPAKPPETTPSKPETKPESKPEPNPVEAAKPADPKTQPPSATPTLADPMVPASTPPGPVTISQGTPVGTAPEQQTSARRRAATLQELEASFAAVRKQPVLEAEIDPLIAELERAMGQLEDSPEGARQRRVLQQRVMLLNLQREYRDQLRTAEERRRSLDSDAQRVAEAVAEVERTRVYTMVGQLQPSSLYDGVNMPRMFRLQSVGGRTPRTLGYLKAGPGLELDKKLGRVVGVVGDTSIDSVLRLNVVTPQRVDVLGPRTQPDPSAVAPGAGVPPATSEPATTPTPASTPTSAPGNPPIEHRRSFPGSSPPGSGGSQGGDSSGG